MHLHHTQAAHNLTGKLKVLCQLQVGLDSCSPPPRTHLLALDPTPLNTTRCLPQQRSYPSGVVP